MPGMFFVLLDLGYHLHLGQHFRLILVVDIALQKLQHVQAIVVGRR